MADDFNPFARPTQYIGGVDEEDAQQYDPRYRDGWSPVTEDDLESSWSDFGNALTVAGANFGANVAAAGQDLTGGWDAGNEFFDGVRRYFASKATDTQRYYTPYFRDNIVNRTITGINSDSVWTSENPGEAIAAQLILQGPNTLASIVTGAVATVATGNVMVGLAAGKATNMALVEGDLANSIYGTIDSMSHEDLMNMPAYRSYIDMGYDPDSARRAYMEEVAGVAPFVAGALSSFLFTGAEGVAARALAGTGVKGIGKGILQGATAEAGQEAFEEGTQEALRQEALNRAQLLDEYTYSQMLANALEGAFYGGVLGGAAGGVAGAAGPHDTQERNRQPKRTPVEVVEDNAPNAAMREAIQAATAGTSAPETAIPETVAPPSPPVQEAAPAPAQPPAAAPVEMGIPETVAPTAPSAVPSAPAAEIAPVAETTPEPLASVATTEVTPEGNAVEGTTPEAPETLAAQFDELARDIRQAVLIPKGVKAEVPQGLKKSVIKGEGTLYYKPPLTDAIVRAIVKEGKLGQLLGMAETTKNDVAQDVAQGAEPAVVTVRTPDGVPVVDAATSSATVEQDVAQIAEKSAPENTVEVRDFDAVLDERVVANQPQQPVADAPVDTTEVSPLEPVIEPVAEEKPTVLPDLNELAKEEAKKAEVASKIKASDQRTHHEIPKSAEEVDVKDKKQWDSFKRRVSAAVKKGNAHPLYEEAAKLMEKLKPIPAKTQPTTGMYKALRALQANEHIVLETAKPAAEKRQGEKRTAEREKEREIRREKASAAYSAALKRMLAKASKTERARIEAMPEDELRELVRLTDKQYREAAADLKGIDIEARGSGTTAQKSTKVKEAVSEEIEPEQETPDLTSLVEQDEAVGVTEEADLAPEQEVDDTEVNPNTVVTTAANPEAEQRSLSKEEQAEADKKADAKVEDENIDHAPDVDISDLVEAMDEALDEETSAYIAKNLRNVKEKPAVEKDPDLPDFTAGQDRGGKVQILKRIARRRVVARKTEAAMADGWTMAGGETDNASSGRHAFDGVRVDADTSPRAQQVFVTRAGRTVTPVYTSTVEHAIDSVMRNASPDALKGIKGMVYRVMAKRLTTLVGNRPVYFLPEADIAEFSSSGKATALYRADYDGIFIPIDKGEATDKMLHVVLHEALHIATFQALNYPQNTRDEAFRNAVKVLRDAYLRSQTGVVPDHAQYALTSPDEFMSEALSNPEFMDDLAKIDLTPQHARRLGMDTWRPRTLMDGLVSAIRKWLGLMPNTHSVLEGVLRSFDFLTGDVNTTTPRSLMHDTQLPLERALTLANVVPVVRTIAQNQSAALSSPKWGKRLVQLMTLEQINQKFAKLFPADTLTKLVRRIQEITPYANNIRKQSEKLAQEFAELSMADQAAWSELAVTATNLNVNLVPGVSPNAIVMHPSNKHLGKDVMNAAQAKALLPDLQRRLNALSPEAQAHWAKAKDYYVSMQERLTKARIEDLLREVKGTLSPQEIATIANEAYNGTMGPGREAQLGKVLYNALSDLRLRVQKGMYAPQMRFGEYVVVTRAKMPANLMGGKEIAPGVVEFRAAKDKDARNAAKAFAGSLNDIIVQSIGKEPTSTATDYAYRVRLQLEGADFFESAGDAKRFMEEAKNDAFYDKVSSVQLREDIGYGGGDLTTQQLAALVKSVEGNKSAEKAVKQAAAMLMTGNRIQHRSIVRRRVRGASHEFTRVALAYGESASRYLARMELMPDANEALKEMRKHNRDQRFDNLSDIRSIVLRTIESRVQSGTIVETEVPAWVHTLLTISYLDKLASPAYSFIQSMQPGTVTLPYLAGEHGIGAATRALAEAYKKVGVVDIWKAGGKNTWTAGKEFGSLAINSEDVLGSVKARLTGDDLKVIQYLEKYGKIEPQAGFELAQSISQARGQRLARIDRVARQLPAAIEVMNRAVSGLSAYQLGKAKGMTEQQALEYALRVTDLTQGDYSPMNAAPLFNHPLGRIALQFKKYSQMVFFLYGDMLHRAMKGATQEEKVIARKQLAYFTATTMVVAGLFAIPGSEGVRLALMIGSALGLPDYEELERDVYGGLSEMFGPTVAGAVVKGVPYAIPGVGIDLSGRLGMDSMLTFGEPQSGDADDVLNYVAKTVMGAPGGLFYDAYKRSKEFADSPYGAADMYNWMRLIEGVPGIKVAMDAVKSTREYAYGTRSQYTGKYTDEPGDFYELVMGTVGLQTADETSRMTERRAMDAALSETRDTGREYTTLRNRFAEARTEGERVRVLKELRALNASLPDNLKHLRQTPAEFRKFRKSYLRDQRKGLTRRGFRFNDEAKATIDAIDERY